MSYSPGVSAGNAPREVVQSRLSPAPCPVNSAVAYEFFSPPPMPLYPSPDAFSVCSAACPPLQPPSSPDGRPRHASLVPLAPSASPPLCRFPRSSALRRLVPQTRSVPGHLRLPERPTLPAHPPAAQPRSDPAPARSPAPHHDPCLQAARLRPLPFEQPCWARTRCAISGLPHLPPSLPSSCEELVPPRSVRSLAPAAIPAPRS